MKKDVAQLHDNALDYEQNIEIDVGMLSETRLKMYQEQDADILRLIIPALNTIIHDAERYREWVLKQY